MNLLEYYKSMPDLFSCIKHPEKDIYIIRYHHLGINWAMSGQMWNLLVLRKRCASYKL